MKGNIFDRVNQQIHEFVQRPENSRLIPGTGHYSALFRGGLFGQEMSAEVAKQLNVCEGVDVLWLGTNPCVEDSLKHILGPQNRGGDFSDFEHQMRSGFFGSRRWDDNGNSCPDWNPIENPKRNWRVYRHVLAKIALDDRIAMANFIPWGSATGKDLVTKLDRANRPLLSRMLAFADEINVAIVQGLKPRLILVPHSLGEVIRQVGMQMEWSLDRTHWFTMAAKKYRVVTGHWKRGCLNVRTACLPHPAGLRLRRDDRMRFVEEVSTLLEDFIGPRRSPHSPVVRCEE